MFVCYKNNFYICRKNLGLKTLINRGNYETN